MLVEELQPKTELSKVPLVELDPTRPPTLTQGYGQGGNQNHIQFPEPSYKLNKLLTARRLDQFDEEFDEEDRAIFEVEGTD